jgi:hypothetical protein
MKNSKKFYLFSTFKKKKRFSESEPFLVSANVDLEGFAAAALGILVDNYNQ